MALIKQYWITEIAKIPVIVNHPGELKTVHKYGVHAYDTNNNIVAIYGMSLKVEYLPDQKGELTDYFLAWGDGIQGGGETHNGVEFNVGKDYVGT